MKKETTTSNENNIIDINYDLQFKRELDDFMKNGEQTQQALENLINIYSLFGLPANDNYTDLFEDLIDEYIPETIEEFEAFFGEDFDPEYETFLIYTPTGDKPNEP